MTLVVSLDDEARRKHTHVLRAVLQQHNEKNLYVDNDILLSVGKKN